MAIFTSRDVNGEAVTVPIVPRKQLPVKKKIAPQKDEALKKIERKPLDTEEVNDLNFFLEDLRALDENVNRADDLYNKIYGLYNNLTGGEYVPTRNIRDIAELVKSLVSARSNYSDAVQKRINLKKLLNDIEFRKSGGIDELGGDMVTQTARQIVSIVRQQAIEDNKSGVQQPKLTDKRTIAGKKRAMEIDALEARLSKSIESGEISMSKNDELVGTNEYVVTRFDPQREEFVAVDSRDGSIIKDFPKDRLPSQSVANIRNGIATLNDGSEIPVFDKFEYDDDYVED